jgi:hypothetical protein
MMRLERKASPQGWQQPKYYHNQQQRIYWLGHPATRSTISSRSLAVLVEAEGCLLGRQPVSRLVMVELALGLDQGWYRLRRLLLRAWRRRWLRRLQILARRGRRHSRRRTIFLGCFSCVFSLQCLILFCSLLLLSS